MLDKIFIKLLLFYILNFTIFLQALGFPIQAKQGDLYISTLVHPAGPTIKREWLTQDGSLLYRLEFDDIKTGQIVLDKNRLIYSSKLGWQFTGFDGNLLLTITSKDIRTSTPRSIKIGDHEWVFIVRGESIPKVIPGIATESENSLDITLIRIR